MPVPEESLERGYGEEKRVPIPEESLERGYEARKRASVPGENRERGYEKKKRVPVPEESCGRGHREEKRTPIPEESCERGYEEEKRVPVPEESLERGYREEKRIPIPEESLKRGYRGEREEYMDEKNVTTADPQATTEARELLRELHSVAGRRIITGQHTQTIPCEEIEYIKQMTGREPRLRGFELLAYSPNINYADASPECLREVEENKGTVETALQWARQQRDAGTNGILTFTFHWFSPLGGRDKSFYTEHTDFDASRILIPGTPEREAFYRDMDVIAEILQRFQDENIPILWRPFHEAYGTWFWWGAKGPEVARDLFRLMYDYYTGEKGLHNLLWVWNSDIPEGYPGDAYVDVVSIDVYLPEYRATDYAEAYEKLVAATSRDKVAALAEIGYLPDVEMLEQSRIPWAYYMTWSKEFCIGESYNKIEQLRRMYDSDYTIKL